MPLDMMLIDAAAMLVTPPLMLLLIDVFSFSLLLLIVTLRHMLSPSLRHYLFFDIFFCHTLF